MNFKKLKSELKNELKTIAVDIRDKKGQRKQSKWSGFVKGLSTGQTQFRVKHIAYCMLRGTPYEKIESKHKDIKDPTHAWCKNEAMGLLGSYKDQLGERHETVCSSS